MEVNNDITPEHKMELKYFYIKPDGKIYTWGLGSVCNFVIEG